MALTDAQKVDVTRWAGYSIGGIDYANIVDQLDALGSAEEEALTTKYLSQLAVMETALAGVGDNLDTKIAGPWTANDRELAQRTALYDKFRRDMCSFLGFSPGPSLGMGGNSIPLVRC